MGKALKHNRNSHFAKSEFSGGVGLKKRASFKIAWCNEMSSCYYPIIREAPSTKKRSSFLLKQLSYCILVSLHSDLKLSKKSHSFSSFQYETFQFILSHCAQESNRLFFQMSNRWGSNRQEKGSKLNLRNTKRTDTGQYTCVASNGIGQPATSQITLRVQCKYPSSLSWLSEMMQAGASVVAAAEAIFINAFPSPL